MKHALVALVLASPSLALADPSREAVSRLLAGYEVHAGAAEWKRLGAGTDRVLIELILDPGTPPVRRLRAMSALSLVPSAAGRDLCRRILVEESGATEGREVLEVGACAKSLGVIAGIEGIPELLPLLSHPSSDVRLGAVRGLRGAHVTASSPAAAALRRLAASDEDDTVKAESRAALRDLEAK